MALSNPSGAIDSKNEVPASATEPEAGTGGGEVFSVFTPWQKRWICFAASFAGMFSTMSSYIYYPALVPVSLELGVSLFLVNLTVTCYLVVAGIAPAFMGDMADQSGRRPVYMLMFSLMIGANIGIALQKSYPALFVLRMLQSAGSSGLYGAAYGVISDFATVEERGNYVGALLLMTDIAPSLGPVIGGSITQQVGWRWIFWFLVIMTGTHFIAMLLFFPETQRRIVGNGSAKVRGVYWSFFSARNRGCGSQNGQVRFPNPLSCLEILSHKGSLAVIMITAVTYAVKMALQTSLSAQCVEIYNLNYLVAGLIYLPSGIGGGVASYLTGQYIDWTYRGRVKHLQDEGSSYDGSASPDFPLEKTRLKGIYVLITISALGTLGYGLALMTRTHISVVLIMQFLTGSTTASTFTMCGTLLTDLNINKSATAQAASNLVRCLSAGAAIAALQPLVDAAGPAWCFAVYAIVVLLEVPLVWLLQQRGVRWRRAQCAA
ncbi:MFS general substrate transporter [Phialemonium atrogriseum]|uniref:MFS general substrate transporter n=1 Tax=Phialemonium atrogriseum TaxID=1093897 RepID=A0AAJ0BXK5_9PEZI|nr:MFS general substrate transporter [Phialemonium atrogriseum]KAK1764932.1 MFS general substrate transporter [Phialemonium atrogriseum]